jgi:hypothetical protein
MTSAWSRQFHHYDKIALIDVVPAKNVIRAGQVFSVPVIDHGRSNASLSTIDAGDCATMPRHAAPGPGMDAARTKAELMNGRKMGG